MQAREVKYSARRSHRRKWQKPQTWCLVVYSHRNHKYCPLLVKVWCFYHSCSVVFRMLNLWGEKKCGDLWEICQIASHKNIMQNACLWSICAVMAFVCSIHVSWGLMAHISFPVVFFDPCQSLWYLPSFPLIPHVGAESGETHTEESKQLLFSIMGPLSTSGLEGIGHGATKTSCNMLG